MRVPVQLHASRLLCTVPTPVANHQAEDEDSRSHNAELAVESTSALNDTVHCGDDGAGAASSKDDYEDDAFLAAAQDAADAHPSAIAPHRCRWTKRRSCFDELPSQNPTCAPELAELEQTTCLQRGSDDSAQHWDDFIPMARAPWDHVLIHWDNPSQSSQSRMKA